MDLKSQAGLAGLLTGFAGSIQDIVEKQNQQKLAAQRRSEVEQFQISERENARQIRADEKSEVAQQKQASQQSGLTMLKGFLDNPPKDQAEATMNLGKLSQEDQRLVPLLAHAYSNMFKDVTPKYDTVEESPIGKDGFVHRVTYKRDTNPDSPSYGDYKTEPDSEDRMVFGDVPISAGTIHNANFTGHGGSATNNLSSKVMARMNQLFGKVTTTKSIYGSLDTEASSAQSLADQEKLQNAGALTPQTQKKMDAYKTQLQRTMNEHAASVSVMQNEVDNLINGNKELVKAKKVDQSLSKVSKDKSAYWNGVVDAYKKGKIDNTDFMVLQYKYESRFAELPPQTTQPEVQEQTEEEPQTQTPQAKWQFEQ